MGELEEKLRAGNRTGDIKLHGTILKYFNKTSQKRNKAVTNVS